ncbi:ROK family protein [Kribbella sp. CA-247076]|uniref:ROK family protein n=1 Tax=Kribbella sp. CA-247076 TaxID=3239941 RepID=UPI003D92164E
MVTDLEGVVLQQTRVAVSARVGRRERLAKLDDCVRRTLAAAGVRPEQVWSTGVATTGLVDGTGKVMLSDSVPEWTGVDLAGHLRRLVAAPVRVENDCKLAALAESWRGVARHAGNVVFLLAGLRTGAGLIIDGKLHRGFSNAAGEIGALPAAGWLRAPQHLNDWLVANHPPGTERAEYAGDDVEPVFLAARDGERGAARAVRGYVRDIAVGASALVLMLDPELVVIGGGFSRSADVLVEPLRRELDRWCLRTPEIRVSEFGDEGVALGAVRLALEEVEATRYDGNLPRDAAEVLT